MPQKTTDQQVKGTTVPAPIEYELTVVGGYDEPDIEADLKSPLLDAVMHPKGVLRVNIENDAKAKKGKPPRVLLDSFHVDSLVEYLRAQPHLRQLLAEELARDQEKWDPHGGHVAGDPWAGAKLRSLDLRRRKLPTPKFLAELQALFTPEEVKGELAGMDEPDTRTAFAIVLDCAWDDEHQVKAMFRNGAFVSVNHE